jgi:hypothetical protein
MIISIQSFILSPIYLGFAKEVCGASDTKLRGEVVLEYYDAEAMQ